MKLFFYHYIYPDGIYFMDDDGFGMYDGKEECIGAYINRQGRIIIPFCPMNDSRTRENDRKKALIFDILHLTF